MEEKRRRGEPLDDHLPDAILAATAVCRGLTVATRNVSEYRRVIESVHQQRSCPGDLGDVQSAGNGVSHKGATISPASASLAGS